MSELEALERQLEADRAALARSLDTLSTSLSPDRVGAELKATIQSCSGELGNQAWHAARGNPAAFALVTAGLGLLLTGAGKRAAPERRAPLANDPNAAMVGFDERVEKADKAMKKEQKPMNTPHPKASRLRAALDYGLDKLPDAARRRVIKAREAAAEAQEKVEAQADRMARKTKSFAHDQPLAAGALAFGVGALIGAMLPSSRREDQLLGAHRDAMMQRARDALREEIEALGASAQETHHRESA